MWNFFNKFHVYDKWNFLILKQAFKNKWILKHSKHCLKIQNKNNNVFSCTFCNTSVSTKQDSIHI